MTLLTKKQKQELQQLADDISIKNLTTQTCRMGFRTKL